MTDYTQLIEQLMDEPGGLSQPAADAIEALQLKVRELNQEVKAKTYQLGIAHAARDSLLEKLAAKSPTALELMKSYSDGKQWALEEAAKVCDAQVNKANAKGEVAKTLKAIDVWSAVAQTANASRIAIRNLAR
jgi:hypothetical protein